MNTFIPVLVDADTEKEVIQKFSVHGFPHLKFLDATEKSHGVISGFVDTSEALNKMRAAGKAAPQGRPSKEYKDIYKASLSLAKAMAKKKYADALEEIAKLGEFSHKGMDFEKAKIAKAEILVIAQKEFEEAKALIESKPDKAKSELTKFARTFKGLELAEEAKKLAEGIGE